MVLRRALSLVVVTVMVLPVASAAQVSKLKVTADDSVPVAFAFVTIDGGTGQITNEMGEVGLGQSKKQTLTVRVQRIGFQPWFGKLELPDTAVVIRIAMSRIAQALSTVKVRAATENKSLQLRGFYDRWMMRQKGTLSAVFIGPEEIEFRHPNKITNMLRGLSGVSFKQSCENELAAFSYNQTCPMAILVDGVRQCPGRGCNMASPQNLPAHRDRVTCDSPLLLDESTAVLIDRILDANDVAGIEVYNRGGNMPVSLAASDQACGVIALWTGSRKP